MTGRTTLEPSILWADATLGATAVAITITTVRASALAIAVTTPRTNAVVLTNTVHGKWTGGGKALNQGPTIVVQSMNMRGCNIPETSQCIEVDTLRKTVQPTMGWKESSVKILTIRIDMRLQSGNGVCVVGVLNCP
jgi:hypothetical protein